MSADLVDLTVLSGIEMQGKVNTADETLLAQITHSIRLGYPQVRPQPLQRDRIVLVGGGPSLEDTLPELTALYFEGAKVVTVNGSYQWCLDRRIRPSAHIVLDARAENARFVSPAVSQCKYLLASQCHPETWAAVQRRENVWIWHAVAPDNPTAKPLLDAYYHGQWTPSPGGTTVIMRAITLLRTLGFARFNLFGVDSCVRGTQHHAYQQPENDADRVFPFEVFPTGHPEQVKRFWATAWHAKQVEDALQLVRLHGESIVLHIHGDGMLAYAFQACADVSIQKIDDSRVSA